MFQIVTNLITPRALFSPILLRYRTKYELDHYEPFQIWPFEIFQNARSVGRSSVLNTHSCHTLLFAALYMSDLSLFSANAVFLRWIKICVCFLFFFCFFWRYILPENGLFVWRPGLARTDPLEELTALPRTLIAGLKGKVVTYQLTPAKFVLQPLPLPKLFLFQCDKRAQSLIECTATCKSQLTLSLYLMTRCQLKLRHSVTSLALQTFDCIKDAQRRPVRDYTLDQLRLKLNVLIL